MLRWFLIRSIHPPLRNAPENTFTFICPSIISPDLSFPYIHNFITYSQGIFTRKNLKPTSLKKKRKYILEVVCLLLKLMVKVSSQWTNGCSLVFHLQEERDPSFQCEKITECSNLREKYFTKKNSQETNHSLQMKIFFKAKVSHQFVNCQAF